MAARANWKGYLKVAELSCPVALYTAASSAERIAFNTLNRATGHRVHRQFVDQETGEPVANDAQVKGYETGPGEYVVLQPEDIAAAVPQSDRTLEVMGFLPCHEIDDVYFDRPYYLAPSEPAAGPAFALIREAMRAKKVAALARTVLFRRVRTVLVRPHGDGLIATTLNFDYEVRSAEEAFADMPELKIEGEMLDLARHIIDTKRGHFDPSKFDDRYEEALAELVRAKIAGRALPTPKKPPAPTSASKLLDALRASAGTVVKPRPPAKARAKTKPEPQAEPRRKAS